MTSDLERLRRLRAFLRDPAAAEAPEDAGTRSEAEAARAVAGALELVRTAGAGAEVRPHGGPASVRSRAWYLRPEMLPLSLALNMIFLALILQAGRFANPFAKHAPNMTVENRQVFLFDPQRPEEAFWNVEFPSQVLVAKVATWDKGARELLVSEEGVGDGILHCYDFRKKKQIWSHTVERDEVRDFFGADLVDPGTFRCIAVDFVDLEGDGEPEIIATFVHKVYLPCVIRTYSRDGTVLGTYLNWGLMYATTVTDLDGDGRQELVLGGTDNARQLQAAAVVVLDRNHLNGASVDRFIERPGYEDGSRARLLLPQYPPDVMKALNWDRLHAFKVVADVDAQKRPMVRVELGTPAERVEVQVGPNLEPHDLVVADTFRRKLAGWKKDGTITSDLGDEKTLQAWLDGHYRFESGWQLHPLPDEGK